jgi:hypothetical protein
VDVVPSRRLCPQRTDSYLARCAPPFLGGPPIVPWLAARPSYAKNTSPLDASPRSSSGLIVHGAWRMRQSAAFVARGLPPTRRVVGCEACVRRGCRRAYTSENPTRATFPRSGVLAEVRRTPSRRTSRNAGYFEVSVQRGGRERPEGKGAPERSPAPFTS